MIYLLIVLSFFVGYYLRDIKDRLLRLTQKIEGLKTAKDKPKTASMGFGEPMTRAELAALAEDEKIRLLNP